MAGETILQSLGDCQCCASIVVIYTIVWHNNKARLKTNSTKMYVESFTGQQHDRVQTESQELQP